MKKAPLVILPVTILVQLWRGQSEPLCRIGFHPSDYSAGWNVQPNSDCVFTGSGSCEQQSGWDITGAYKHYWLPTLASAVYGSYMEVHYSGDALTGFGGGVAFRTSRKPDWHQSRVDPLKGFDIGAEFMYVHLNQNEAGRPRPGCRA